MRKQIMCGINGLYGQKDESISAEIMRQMNKVMEHRGPDDSGVFSQENIALGHQRLSILDLSSSGKQPMVDTSGRYVIAFNGEIYNFKELKKQLPDYPFTNETDTEMVLAAYSTWGVECLERFNGMFAIAIWDKIRKELFLARDRVGIKPIYYTQKEGLFAFSSEIRSLLESKIVEPKLNHSCLSEFLEYQTVHTPNTLVKNVYMLEPGHWLKVSEEGINKHCYWDITKKVDNKDTSKEDAKKRVKSLFFESVERRMISDVPLGAFLSGGIDSSAVVAAMSSIKSTKIDTFNISFAEREFSEAVYAEEIAKKFNTNHHEIHLTPNHFLEELPNAINAMDHPSGDGPNSFVVSKATKQAGITVALSGLGGDELFCGYNVFPLLKKLETSGVKSLPLGVRKMIGSLFFSLKKGNNTLKIKQLLSTSTIDFEHSYPLFRQTLWRDEIENILPSYKEKSISHFLMKGDQDLYSKISVAEMGTYMQSTLLRDTDQMSMASALEVRVPFLDHTLVEELLSYPDELKHPLTPKKLFVDSMGDLLPESIWKRKKMGFTLPWSVWMKKELKDYCEVGLSQLQNIQGLNYSAIEALWNNFINNKPLYTWTRVWPLVVLGHWIKKNNIEG